MTLFPGPFGPQRNTFAAHARRVVQASDLLRLFSPAKMMDGILQKLAGTDMASRIAFTVAADDYGQALRRHFEPLTLSNIGSEGLCAICPGRLNFAGYDAVPTFLVDQAAGDRRWLGMLAVLYLLLATLITGVPAARRFRRWPT